MARIARVVIPGIPHHVRRPLGKDGFIEKLEKMTARVLKPKRPGPNKNR